MYVYMVRSEYSDAYNEDVYNEAIFDSLDKAIQFINEWDDLDYDSCNFMIVSDETRGEGLSYIRTIVYEHSGPDQSLDLFIDKYKVNSIICAPIKEE